MIPQKNSFLSRYQNRISLAQIWNAKEALVLSDALLLAARVSCSSKQVVNNNNDNDCDDHEEKKLEWQGWQVF